MNTTEIAIRTIFIVTGQCGKSVLLRRQKENSSVCIASNSLWCCRNFAIPIGSIFIYFSRAQNKKHTNTHCTLANCFANEAKFYLAYLRIHAAIRFHIKKLNRLHSVNSSLVINSSYRPINNRLFVGIDYVLLLFPRSSKSIQWAMMTNVGNDFFFLYNG